MNRKAIKLKRPRKFPPNLYKDGESWYVSFTYRRNRVVENIGQMSESEAIAVRDQLMALERQRDLARTFGGSPAKLQPVLVWLTQAGEHTLKALQSEGINPTEAIEQALDALLRERVCVI